ncbi:hypothetical protein [Wolbachia endosymbiont of Cantharis cryptica]|uniref:hypothetical protein n=1 Tax=Wolbachia endosymbiont of Cantharis cryptica TaxID=3066132 RepID=UPI00376EAFDA
MLESLKEWGTNLVLGVKDLVTSPESQVYVKDLRRGMTHDGRKCQYPENYDEIVKSGKIIESKDKDIDGKTIYKLLYGEKDKDGRQPSFELTLVKETDDRSYFTIGALVSKDRREIDDYSEFYEPFGFSRLNLREYVPIFEAQKTNDPQYPFELTNSSVLTKEVKNKEGKVQKVVDKKGRNGEPSYIRYDKKLSIDFFEIRNRNGNLELDKSLISVPIVFVAGLAKVCAKLLTFLPMKLGEYLLSKQNPIAKSLGYLLFIPAAVVKNLVNMGATILKAPILLLVANKEEYGDAYLTMWKCKLEECWKEAKNDYSVVKEGKRSEPEEKDYPEYEFTGTWKELDAMRLIEREREEQKSGKKVSGEQLELQNEINEEKIAESQKAGTTSHVEELKNSRLQQEKSTQSHQR